MLGIRKSVFLRRFSDKMHLKQLFQNNRIFKELRHFYAQKSIILD
jgi:hypothetical protein